MILALLKRDYKSNYKLFFIVLAVLTLYMAVIIGMFDPSAKNSIEELLATMPKELVAAMGMNTIDSSLTGFIGTYYYGFLILLLPMILEIAVANRLIARPVDSGSMVYLLSSPYKRSRIALTQAAFLLFQILKTLLYTTLLGLVLCAAMFPGKVDVTKFILLNVGALLLHFVISGIAFLATCLFNDSKNSLMMGAGIPVGFFLLQMLSNMGGKLDVLKYCSIFSFYNPTAILEGNENTALFFVIMLGISLLLYGAGILIFSKKDLPL